jgi:hypothetical protein
MPMDEVSGDGSGTIITSDALVRFMGDDPTRIMTISRSSIMQFPDTKLAIMLRMQEEHQMQPGLRVADVPRDVIVLDENVHVLSAILDFYRYRVLARPPSISEHVFKAALDHSLLTDYYFQQTSTFFLTFEGLFIFVRPSFDHLNLPPVAAARLRTALHELRLTLVPSTSAEIDLDSDVSVLKYSKHIPMSVRERSMKTLAYLEHECGLTVQTLSDPANTSWYLIPPVEVTYTYDE